MKKKLSRLLALMFPPIALAAAGSLATLLCLRLGVAHAAARLADPVVSGGPPAPIDWGFWAAVALGALALVLHPIAAKLHSAKLERLALLVDELRAVVPNSKPALAVAPPPRDKQAGRVRHDVLSWLTGIGLGAAALIAGGLTVASCTATQARQTAAAGVVAALVCEDGHIDANALADAKAFAAAKVQQWLTGGSKPSSAAIRADLAPIKSDLGRCAITGALAAATTAVAPTPGVAVSALTSGPDPAQVRAAFGIAAREEGWPLVVLAGGTAI